MMERALRNYELYHQLKKGSASIKDLQMYPGGIDMFADYEHANFEGDHKYSDEEGELKSLAETIRDHIDQGSQYVEDQAKSGEKETDHQKETEDADN